MSNETLRKKRAEQGYVIYTEDDLDVEYVCPKFTEDLDECEAQLKKFAELDDPVGCKVIKVTASAFYDIWKHYWRPGIERERSKWIQR